MPDIYIYIYNYIINIYIIIYGRHNYLHITHGKTSRNVKTFQIHNNKLKINLLAEPSILTPTLVFSLHTEYGQVSNECL